MGDKDVDKPKRPETKKERALYRASLSCHIGRDACESRGVPDGVNRDDWILYQLFSALEEIVRALGEEE